MMSGSQAARIFACVVVVSASAMAALSWLNAAPPTPSIDLAQAPPDNSVGLMLTWTGNKVNEPLFVVQDADHSFTIEIIRAQKSPAVGLMTMPNAAGCLVQLNQTCIIAGRKLTLE